MANVCRKIFVSGQVQGVFFRESTRRIAKELRLIGGVRNLYDGRVEVQVSGEEENVQLLIKWLKIGPNLAKVSNIEVMTIKVLTLPSGERRGQQIKSFEVWPSL